MKIGINALFFKFPTSGSGQYLTHLLSALTEVDSQNEYVLLGPQQVEQSSISSRFPYVVKPIPAFAGRSESIKKLLWEQFTAPAAARSCACSWIHRPSRLMSSAARPTLLSTATAGMTP